MTSPDLSNPFPGLRCFQADEDYLFFGRHEQIEDLLRRLRQNRLVAVVGTSGSGKSSLVRAGLLPAMLGGGMSQAGSDWEIAVMRPGGSPLAQLVGALCDAGLYDADAEDAQFHLRATLTRSRNGLIEALRQSRAAAGSRLLLVVDQFEELFRFNRASVASQEESVQFVNLLLHATQQPDQKVYVVLTMRSDFLGECSQFLGLAEAVNEGEFLIPRMTRDQIQEAIEGPIRVRGASISPRLLFRLLNDVEDNQDQLPVLQHALMRTWDLWKRSSSEEVGRQKAEGRTEADDSGELVPQSQIANRKSQITQSPLDLEHYEATGGMHQALSRHADEVFAALPSEGHRTAAVRIFQALTERGPDGRGIRRPTRLNGLVRIAGVEASVAMAVIEAYRVSGVTFLMPPTSVPLVDSTVIDISHESLMRVWARLRDWVEEEAQSVGIFHRLAESAALQEVGKAGLYRDPELNIALSWREETKPNAAWAEQYGGGFERAMAYLERSRAEAEREEKEREAARQRELRQARELAEAQSQRAEAQRRAARRLRAGLAVVAGVAVVAVVATVIAIQLRGEAIEAKANVNHDLYVADMNRAGQAYHYGNIDVLEQLLERHLPTEGEPRGPEYYFWRHAARRELDSMTSAAFLFCDLAVAPDQKTVAAIGMPNDVGIYDVASHQLIKLFDVSETARAAPDMRLTFSPHGRTLTIWGRMSLRGIYRFDTQTWQRKDYELSLMLSVTNSQQVPTNGNALVVVARVGTKGHENLHMQIFDSSGTEVIDKGEQDLTPGAKLDELKALIDSGSRSGFTNWSQIQDQKVMDLVTSASGYTQPIAPVLTIGRDSFGQPRRVVALAYSPHGSLLAAGGNGGRVVLWDRRTWKEHVFNVSGEATNSVVTALAFSPDGHLLVAALAQSADNFAPGALVSLDVTRNQVVARRVTTSWAEGLDFSPDGRLLVTGHRNGEVNLWDTPLNDESHPRQLFKNSVQVSQVLFSPKGRYLAVSTDERNAIKVWKVPSLNDPSENTPRLIATLKGHSRRARFAFVGDEGTLWSASFDHSIKVWNVRQSGLYTEVPESKDAQGLVYLAGGARGRLAWRNAPVPYFAPAAAASPIHTVASRIHIYDVATATNLPPWQEGKRFWIYSSSANGHFLAALGADGQIRLWNYETGKLLGTTNMVVPTIAMNFMKVANDGNWVVWREFKPGAVHEEEFQLWSPRTGLRTPLPEGGISPVAAAFSPDSPRLAITGYGGSLSEPSWGVRVWDLNAKPIAPPKSKAGIFFAVDFSPDGTRLALGGENSEIRVVNTQTLQFMGDPLVGHAAELTCVKFFPDGKTLISEAGDQTIRMWDADADTDVQLTTLPALDTRPVPWAVGNDGLTMDSQGRWVVSHQGGEPARIWWFGKDRDPLRTNMLWLDEGEPAAERGEFAKAREVAQQAVTNAPDQDGGTAWFALAALAVHQGDLKKFQQIRSKMVARYGEKPYLMPGGYTAFVCTILPSSPEQLKTSQELARRVTAGKAPGWLPELAQIALILGKYRAGDYPAAVSAAESYPADHFWLRALGNVPVQLALAMSQQQLGKSGEARDALDHARKLMEDLNKSYPGTLEHPSTRFWSLWMFDTALMHEAEALIGGGK